MVVQLIASGVSFAYPPRAGSGAGSRGEPPMNAQGERVHNKWASGRATNYERASLARLAEPDLVLDRMSLRVGAGTRLGVVGENGCGKSTLLAVLAGRLEPTAGTVTRRGSLELVPQVFEFEPRATVGTLTSAAIRRWRSGVAGISDDDGATNMSMVSRGESVTRNDDEEVADWEAAQAEAERRLDQALTRLGAVRDLARPLATMSVGERFRARLACALATKPDLLLLDEPTNHLDDSALDYLTAAIKAWRGGVVLVTHDRQLLDDVATGILDLDLSADGTPTFYGRPGYDAYRAAKAARLRAWRARYAADQRRQAELLARRDRTYEGLSDEWRPPKGSQKHRRGTRARAHVKAADRLIASQEANQVPVPKPPLQLEFPRLPAAEPGWDLREPLLALTSPLVLGGLEGAARAPADGASERAGEGCGASDAVSQSAIPRKPRLDLPDADVRILPGGRLVVVGPNGAGKSTLLGALVGAVPLARGARQQRAGLRVGVVGQENRPIDARAAGLAALYQDGDHNNARRRGAESQMFAHQASPTGFDVAALDTLRLLEAGELDPAQVVPITSLGLLTEAELSLPLAELSAGQRRRFEIARALIAAPHVLVLDEPTNHLATTLIDELTQALLATDAAVVVATHDRKLRADLAAWPSLAL